MLVQRALRDLAVKGHPPHLLPVVWRLGAGMGSKVLGDRSDLDVLGVRVALEAAAPDTCDLRREIGAFAVPFLTTAPSRLRGVGSATGGTHAGAGVAAGGGGRLRGRAEGKGQGHGRG